MSGTHNFDCNNMVSQIKSDNLNFLNKQVTQWREVINKKFTHDQKPHTTILFGGMTILQDKLVSVALQSLGERYVCLPNADFEAFQIGKAYGNKAQCNPTYFTVGNLIKYLQNLRDKDGLSTKEIIDNYIYVTSGGCGPCRFGMYLTEYRKALRDAGFEGFRVMNFEHDKGVFQSAEEQSALDFTPKFFITLTKAIVIGDLLNILGYKLRPYEIKKGSVDQALKKCEEIVAQAFIQKRSLIKALYKCKKELSLIKLDRTIQKPKVLITGEFWAALTEGDGNYNLHRFLESQGAECVPQPLINRLMLSLWEAKDELEQVHILENRSAKGIDFSALKSRFLIFVGKWALIAHIKLYSKALGLHDYEIPNMEKLAKLAQEYYPMQSRGGEAHLEVAHLLESIKENIAHLVISVKPFGCMPSSSVSDGIQSLVLSHFPEANFLSVETSGEGAVNFYSRVQMALFKAKQLAQEEFKSLKIPDKIPAKINKYTYQPKGKSAGSAAVLMESIS